MTTNTSSLPPLNGLILSGGKSTRMGKDKGLITYHKLPQISHLTNLLTPFCNEVFISAKYKTDYPSHQVIEDQYDFESPLNGIISALVQYPESAWLVIACDMPLIDTESIEYLIKHRTHGSTAVCYQNQESEVEPLFSIWEPHSLLPLQNFQIKGGQSPKKFLATHNVNLVSPVDYMILMNINTTEEFQNLNLKTKK